MPSTQTATASSFSSCACFDEAARRWTGPLQPPIQSRNESKKIFHPPPSPTPFHSYTVQERNHSVAFFCSKRLTSVRPSSSGRRPARTGGCAPGASWSWSATTRCRRRSGGCGTAGRGRGRGRRRSGTSRRRSGAASAATWPTSARPPAATRPAAAGRRPPPPPPPPPPSPRSLDLRLSLTHRSLSFAYYCLLSRWPDFCKFYLVLPITFTFDSQSDHQCSVCVRYPDIFQCLVWTGFIFHLTESQLVTSIFDNASLFFCVLSNSVLFFAKFYPISLNFP